MTGKCETCKWWDRESRTDWTVGYPIKISECKFMPAPIQKSAKDFCGQWKGREIKESQDAIAKALQEFSDPEHRQRCLDAFHKLRAKWMKA